jgi:peptidoglycan/LPS O-acetylase OafA/YrhL
MVIQAGVGAGVSILVAALSYELFEKHFLRLKNRLAPSADGARALAIVHAGLAE